MSEILVYGIFGFFSGVLSSVFFWARMGGELENEIANLEIANQKLHLVIAKQSRCMHV